MKKVFSFDAETNGLWGQAFALAALVFSATGQEIARFIGRCPIEGPVDPWVAENVLPKLVGVPENHVSYRALLAAFAEFYLANKTDCDMIAHVAVPVEARVLIDMHAAGLIGNWDGPFPLIDVAGCLKHTGEDPASVDSYAKKYGVMVDPAEFAGGTHNPLYDSAQAVAVYRSLMKWAPITPKHIPSGMCVRCGKRPVAVPIQYGSEMCYGIFIAQTAAREAGLCERCHKETRG